VEHSCSASSVLYFWIIWIIPRTVLILEHNVCKKQKEKEKTDIVTPDGAESWFVEKELCPIKPIS
jgi:hypothetical protein